MISGGGGRVDYENYHDVSQSYDSTRVPTGVEMILGAFCRGSKRPLKELHVLDAGCGTGNYLVCLSDYVGKVTGLELNEGMMKKAVEKTAHLKNVEVMHGDITNMPYPDDHFHAICCNLVIHHLDAPGTSGFPMVKRFVQEAYRVLKPGRGTLVINTMSPEQCKTPWFFSVVPQAQERFSKRMAEISVLEKFLESMGFTQGTVAIHTNILLKPGHWYNKEGPLSKDWRDTISVYALATPEELEESLRIWKERIKDGTADECLKESDELIRKIGLTTSVVAYK